MANQFLQSLGVLNQFLAGEVSKQEKKLQQKKADKVVFDAAQAVSQLPANATLADINQQRTDLVANAAQYGVLSETLPTINALVNTELQEAKSTAMLDYASKNLGFQGSELLAENIPQLIQVEQGFQKDQQVVEPSGEIRIDTIDTRNNEIIRTKKVNFLGIDDKLAVEKEKIRFQNQQRFARELAIAKAKGGTKAAFNRTDNVIVGGEYDGSQVVTHKQSGLDYIVSQDRNGETIYTQVDYKNMKVGSKEEASPNAAFLRVEESQIKTAGQEKERAGNVFFNAIRNVDADLLPKDVLAAFSEDQGRRTFFNANQLLDDLIGSPKKLNDLFSKYAEETEDTRIDIRDRLGRRFSVPSSLQVQFANILESDAIIDQLRRNTLTATLGEKTKQQLQGLDNNVYVGWNENVTTYFGNLERGTATKQQQMIVNAIRNWMTRFTEVSNPTMMDWVNLPTTHKANIIKKLQTHARK